MTTGER